MPSISQPPAVLLVEDSEDDAFFFSRALRLAGFTGPFAHLMDGGKARAHLEEVRTGTVGTPDLVFLDLKLPTLSGFEILEWLRAQGFAPPLDIAVLSGSEHREDVDRAMSLGASAYYVKPISVQQLKTRLGTWQQRHAPSAPPETADSTAGPGRPA